MLNRLDLPAIQFAADLYDDGCGRLTFFSVEQLTFGKDEVNTRSHDVAQRTDGPREFSLCRADPVDILYKACGAQRVSLVENFVAHGAARRKAILGHFHAKPKNPLFRGEDDGAILFHFMRNIPGFKLSHDLE